MSTATATCRRCPCCGVRFRPHPRKPSQTYCRERCRHAAYRQRQRDRRDADRSPSPMTSSSSSSRANDEDEVLSAADAKGSDEVGDDVTGGEQGTGAGHAVVDQRAATRNTPQPLNDVVDDEVHDVGRCPHCRQPIALVTLLLTTKAAHVTVPDPPSGPR